MSMIKIDNKLKNNLTLFNKTSLDKEIQKITSIEISKLRGDYMHL